jgi:hypothetical protein
MLRLTYVRQPTAMVFVGPQQAVAEFGRAATAIAAFLRHHK